MQLTKSESLRLFGLKPGSFIRRLHAIGEAHLWCWNQAGAGGHSTVLHQVEDRLMRNAVGFEAEGGYPLVKINNCTWQAIELATCSFPAWCMHIRQTRGSQESDVAFLRVVWACFDLQLGEKHHATHCTEPRRPAAPSAHA